MKSIPLGAIALGLPWALISVAVADVPVSRLVDDPSAMPGFVGTASFNSDDVFLAELDYAVFEPGDYLGTDPSGGTEYLYAYQAIVPGASSQALTAVSVGLLQGGSVTATDWEPAAEAGGIEPLFSVVSESSVVTYFGIEVSPDDFSTVFLYTSPAEPTFAAASALAGGYSDQQLAPSPVPEPATAALLCVAALGLLGYVCRRHLARQGSTHLSAPEAPGDEFSGGLISGGETPRWRWQRRGHLRRSWIEIPNASNRFRRVLP
jgi:hypothetical protein